jgi:hypothetical protein
METHKGRDAAMNPVGYTVFFLVLALLLCGLDAVIKFLSSRLGLDKQHEQRRRDAISLARYLHSSSAWHCGCQSCVREGIRNGETVRGRILGIEVERYMPTVEEYKILKEGHRDRWAKE